MLTSARKVTERLVVAKLGNPMFEEDLVMVKKEAMVTPAPGMPEAVVCKGNQVALLSTKELREVLRTPQTESFVLQKLIKCRGTQAFIHRCCWRNDQFPTGWVISNHSSFHDEDVPLLKRFCTNAAVPMGATIFPLSNLGVRPT